MTDTFDRFLSNRAREMRASEIRELLKMTQKPEVISFAGGLPNPNSFPIDIISELCHDVFATHGKSALQYGTTNGLPILLEAFAENFSNHGVPCNPENILVTSGSQQGLDLISRVLLNPGDVVVVGAPTYLGALGSFRAAQAEFASVELDGHGIKIDVLEETLRDLKARGKCTKFLYLVPDFQNPTGVTMPVENRKRVLELAEEYDILIIEDDPYGRLRFEGEDKERIYSLDRGRGRVLYLATLSKLLAPGFRVAVMVGHPVLMKKIEIAKQSADLCSPTFTQYVAAEYIKRGHLDTHLEDIKKMYRKKRDLMLSALEKYMPKDVEWTHPEGGMFIWLTLPEGYDARELFTKALEKNVAYVVGSAFYATEGGYRSMRLNFSYATDEDIEEGIRRLAQVVEKERPE